LCQGGIHVVAIPPHFMKCGGMGDGGEATVFLSFALEKAQQPERTEGAIRKAFERLGESAWSLGKLTINDPGGYYAPASKLNEARRMALAAVDETWASSQSARLARIAQEIEQAGRIPAQGQQDARTVGDITSSGNARTLKVRCSSRNAFDAAQRQQICEQFDTLVVTLEHASYRDLKSWVDGWKADYPGLKIRLAMPLVSREKERHGLKEAALNLMREGWVAWECADLAGWRFLNENGMESITADWSLYAFNRLAVAELARLGIASFVVSPECDLPTALALAESPLQAEELIYQYTPLFISETAPCVEGASAGADLAFTDKRGNTFVTHQYDHRWVTTHEVPFKRSGKGAELPFLRKRVDLSWAPHGSVRLGV